MRKLLTIIALTAILSATAQTQYDLNRFSGLQSEGLVPADIQNSLRELYKMDKERVREYNKGKMTNRDRVLSASYQINKMMASGRVLYGDPITKMVERVADKLLEDEPELRSQLRFYTVKSSNVNAFCTGQGMIFVNVGLIAQLQDESQLAYVLAHEIVHYVRKHNLEILTRNSRKDAKKGSDDDEIWESDKTVRLLLKYHHRSHAMETEADTIGLRRFYLKAGYTTDLDGIFDVLQYSALPFDEIPFDTNYFNTAHYKVSGDCFLDTVKTISTRDDYDDSRSSHPNIKKRRTLVQELLKNMPAGGKRYVVTTEDEFDRIRTLARFECIRMDLIDAEYANAFYSCYLMQKTMPENLYLEKARLQALYGLAKYKSYQSASSFIPSYSDYEGEIQQIYHFFHKINSKELSALAVKELWKAKQRYPDEEDIAGMLDDAGKDLFVQHKMTRDFFLHPGDTLPAKAAATDTTTKHKNLKYERIKKKKQMEQTTSHLNYVFYELFEAYPDFDDFLQKMENPPIVETDRNIFKGIYLYSPTYRIYKYPELDLKIQKSEAHESELPKLMETVVGEKGFISHDFSDQALQQSADAQSYNEFAQLNEWTVEFLNTRGSVPMHLYTQPQMNLLNEKYDAGLMNLVLVRNFENINNEQSPFYTAISLFSIIGAPPAIYNLFANNEETHIYSILVDTWTGKTKKGSATNLTVKDDPATVKSVLYQHLTEGLENKNDKNDKNKNKKPTTGYLGKRIILNMGSELSFDPQGLLSDKTAFIPIQFSVGGEYILPHNQSISMDFHTRKSVTAYEYFNSAYSDFKIGEFPTRILRLRASYGTYFQATPAPLGPFLQVGMTLTHFSLDTTGGYSTLKVNNLYTKHSCVGLNFILGRNYIFYDRLLLKIAVHYGITFASPFEPYIFSDMNDVFGDNQHTDYDAKVINHNNNARAWISNLFGLELGVGILL